ncbi:hypothetical protein K9M74_00005, partial [Candidatus Woesearchaeota archaeon]|nr:hypothetical protein [Candidatus Woesearchaeota archaeon]
NLSKSFVKRRALVKRSRKGQAALEYLITYGWGFLVILVAIGVLSYFGLLNPQRYVPDTCEFGEQIKCVDHLIVNQEDSGLSGYVVLRVRNNFEEDIQITNASDIDGVISLHTGSLVINRGEIKRVELAIADTKPLGVGDKTRIPVLLEFNRVGGSVSHNISGVVFAEVVDVADLGSNPVT